MEKVNVVVSQGICAGEQFADISSAITRWWSGPKAPPAIPAEYPARQESL